MRKPIRPNIIALMEYAQKEIDNIRNVYKWLASLLTIIVLFGASLIAFVSYNNIKDVRDEMRSEGDRITKNINSELDLIKKQIQFDLEKEVFFVEQEVREKIRTEFDRENIKQLVERVAEEKITLYTDDIIKQRISNDVQPLIDHANKNILSLNTRLQEADSINQINLSRTKNDLNQLLAKSKRELDSLQTISDFVMTVALAQNGDRASWDKLRNLGENKKYIFSERALDPYARIKDDYSNQLSAISFIKPLEWKPGVDPTKLKIDEIIKLYDYGLISNENYYFRLQIIEYLWKRSDFKKYDKLNFLIKVLKVDKHLNVVQYAGKLFSEETKLEIKYLAIDYFDNWWSKNQSKYKE